MRAIHQPAWQGAMPALFLQINSALFDKRRNVQRRDLFVGQDKNLQEYFVYFKNFSLPSAAAVSKSRGILLLYSVYKKPAFFQLSVKIPVFGK